MRSRRIIPHSPNSPPRARFGGSSNSRVQIKARNFRLVRSIIVMGTGPGGHHRLVEVRLDIPQLCYITRNYFMYYLTVPIYLLRD